MEELKFTPSEAVWQEVQKEIRPKKDRRRLLFWWLLPLLAGGSLGVYSIYHSHSTPARLSAAQQKTPPPAAAKTGAPAATVSNDVNLTGTHHTTPANTDNTTDGNTTNVTATTRIASSPARTGSHHAGRRHTGAAGSTSPVSAADKKGGAIAQTGEEQPATEEGQSVITAASTSSEPVALRTAVITPPGKKIFAVGVTASPVLSADKDALKKLSPFKKKMEWVVTVNGGKSGISSGLGPLLQSTSAYDRGPSNAFQSPTTGAGTGQVNANPVSSKPSDIKPGYSFGLGGSLRRYINPDVSIEAGILYSYYSTSMVVGKRSDTGAASVGLSNAYANYSSLSQNNYINRYHFIEVPIRVQKQLGPRSPFSLQGGISIGRLLASSALQYDATKNIYYKDNGVFNKTQLTFSAGLDIRLLRNSPVSVELGPRLQYGMTRLFKNEYYGSRHLLFAGLETRIFFRKK